MYCKRNYSEDNTIYLRQFDFEKKSKIKTTQNVFIIKAKVNNRDIRQKTHKTKRAIYIVVVNRIVASTNSYK